jgi:hypothetical protein
MRLILTTITLTMLAQPVWAGNLVEIQLMDKLDEQRGLCIDIRGHKERAKVHRGLQAHTCYSYQGQIGVDQAFDARLLAQGKFYLPAFEVCMEAEGGVEGARLNLNICNDVSSQRFEFTANNQIRTAIDNELCVTIDASGSKQGGGGTPPHLLRDLTLKNCAKSGSKYTTWRIKEQPSH